MNKFEESCKEKNKKIKEEEPMEWAKELRTRLESGKVLEYWEAVEFISSQIKQAEERATTKILDSKKGSIIYIPRQNGTEQVWECKEIRKWRK
jgi:hypothetical protein